MLRLLRRLLVFLRLVSPRKKTLTLSTTAYEALLQDTMRRASPRDTMFPPRSDTLLELLRDRQRQADNQPKE